jgi:hypothetical protein
MAPRALDASSAQNHRQYQFNKRPPNRGRQLRCEQSWPKLPTRPGPVTPAVVHSAYDGVELVAGVPGHIKEPSTLGNSSLCWLRVCALCLPCAVLSRPLLQLHNGMMTDQTPGVGYGRDVGGHMWGSSRTRGCLGAVLTDGTVARCEARSRTPG